MNFDKKRFLNNLKFYPIVIIFFLLIVIFMAYLCRHCSFWGDDSYYAAYLLPYEGYFDCFIGKTSSEHGAYYIGLVLCKFFSFGLPNLLGIHPADFIGIGHGAIKGIFTAICLYILARFSVVYTKSKAILFSVLFFLTMYFFFNAMNSNVIIISYNFYRYFFSLIFLGLFCHYYYCDFISSYRCKLLDKKLLLIILCGFIIGTSIEISFFSIALLIVLLFIVNCFKKIYPNKRFVLPSLSLFFGIILFTSTPGFKSVSLDRGISTYVLNLSDFKEFCGLYFQVCFQNQIVYWIIFILLAFIAFYFSRKNKDYKKLIFPLLFQISILLVMFSLVLCGKTYDEATRDRFYLHHWNIVFLYKMLILYPFLMFFDYIVKNILKNINLNKQKYIKFLICFCIVCSSIFYISNIIDFLPYSNSNAYIIDKKRLHYMSEKIFRFYILKKEVPILPNLYDESNRCLYPYWRDITIENNVIYNSYIMTYYQSVYNDLEDEYKFKQMCQKGYFYSEDALEKFYELGGTFTDEELKKLKFSRLFNKDFVLNLTN